MSEKTSVEAFDSMWNQMKESMDSRIHDCEALVEGFELAKKFLEDDDDEGFENQIDSLETFISELHRRVLGAKLFLEMRREIHQ